jgi:hypothetical protein
MNLPTTKKIKNNVESRQTNVRYKLDDNKREEIK